MISGKGVSVEEAGTREVQPYNVVQPVGYDHFIGCCYSISCCLFSLEKIFFDHWDMYGLNIYSLDKSVTGLLCVYGMWYHMKTTNRSTTGFAFLVYK